MTSQLNRSDRPEDADIGHDDGPALIGLADVLVWLGHAKKRITLTCVLAAGLAVGIALALPNVYTARATLLPPSGSGSSSGVAALATLGALGGLASGLTPRTPDELYLALLRGDAVLRRLDERFALRDRLEVETFEELRIQMPRLVRVSADRKAGVITIEVDDEDPMFAAELANAYGSELMSLLGRLAVSEAQQRRVFFEQQLRQTQERLIAAEDSMRELQERTGVIVLDKQAEALIQGVAFIRAQLREREVQLRVLRSSATSRNPDVLRLEAEIVALRNELSRMETSSQGRPGGNAEIPVGRLPATAIEYVRARREVKLQEALLEGMLRQFELAKLDEAKEGPLLQVVDAAAVPDRKSKPKRALIVLGILALALVVSIVLTVVAGYARRLRETDPEAGEAWLLVRKAWRPGAR